MPSNAAFLLLNKLRFNANFRQLEALLHFLGILDDQKNVCYEGLVNIFNIRMPYPIFTKIQGTLKYLLAIARWF